MGKVELQEHRDFYMSEVDRLRNDVEVVDEVISIFLQELQGIDDIIRNQQYDEVGVVDDERFSEGISETPTPMLVPTPVKVTGREPSLLLATDLCDSPIYPLNNFIN